MKPSIIHDYHALTLKAQNKRELAQVLKNIPTDILLKVIKRKQYLLYRKSVTLIRFLLAICSDQYKLPIGAQPQCLVISVSKPLSSI